jgi:predicted dehydrogenase
VIVEFGNGSRGLLDLCMFADASKNEQEISVVGDRGKLEAFVTESMLRIGRREEGVHAVTESTIENPDIGHVGLHHGASYLEHVDFAAAIRGRLPAAVTLLDGLWSVAIGVAAHRSIETGAPVDLASLADLEGVG